MKPQNCVTILFLAVLACFITLTSGCKKDKVVEEPAYEVEIRIISPEEGLTILAGQTFTVEVEYTRDNNTIHNVFIEILDKDGKIVQQLMEHHAHQENVFTFKKEDVIIKEPGKYQLKATTTDIHNGNNEEHHEENNESTEHHNMMIHNFTIQ